MCNLYIETLILLAPSEKSIKYYKFEITTKFIIMWRVKGVNFIANHNSKTVFRYIPFLGKLFIRFPYFCNCSGFWNAKDFVWIA